MYVFDRYKLELYIHKLAKQNGAKFKTKRYISKTDTLKEYDYIIGCDGAMSSVRNSLKLPPPNMRLGIYTHIKEKNYDDFVETWPTKSGFFWKIPRTNSTEYGIINRPNQAQKLFNRFCKAHSLTPKEIKSHLIPTGLVLSNNSKIALCGDAAGLTKPWSGGGVVWSFLAADILSQTLPNTELYNKKIKSFFSKRMKATSFLTKSFRLTSKIPSVLPKKRTIDSDFIFKTNI
jgi:flavin-dependent dehydrogenase